MGFEDKMSVEDLMKKPQKELAVIKEIINYIYQKIWGLVTNGYNT